MDMKDVEEIKGKFSDEDFYTRIEISQATGLSLSFINVLGSQGKLPTYKVGVKAYHKGVDIKSYLEDRYSPKLRLSYKAKRMIGSEEAA
jgi:hypothetical protein